MKYKRKLLIVGLCFVERDVDGTCFTKTSIADYINEIAQHFDECTWMTFVFDRSPSLEGKLNKDLVRVISLKMGFSSVKNWLTLVAYLKERPYTILYFPALLGLVFLIPLIRQFSQCMAVYLGNDYEQILKQTGNKWIGYSLHYRLSTEYTLRMANVVIARGKYLADKVARLNTNVIETVPIGHLDLQNFCDRQAFQITDTKRLLYLGQLLWLKGLGDLLKALQFFIKKHPGISILLDIVGDGAERQEIEILAQKLNLGNYVKFHGWVGAKDELYRFFSCADMLVVPTSFYPEGVPRVIDEALMLELPVVATKVGGIAKEFADDEVMLVEPNAPEQLAKSIEKMLLEPQVRKRYLASAKRRTALWTKYGSAAQQHARVILGNLDDKTFNLKELRRETKSISN